MQFLDVPLLACKDHEVSGDSSENGQESRSADDRRRIRVWSSDAHEPTVLGADGPLILDRGLLGKHATADPDAAPILTVRGSCVRVDVRKKRRFVWGLAGRLFESFPGHPGVLGRYWTWVAHPDRDESLVLIRRRPPASISYLEGRIRLHRIGLRPIRGDIDSPLQLRAPCVVVAGVGAVEVAMGRGSTGLARPEPIARLDLDALRWRARSLVPPATRLSVPCVVPGAPRWQATEHDASEQLASLLEDAFRGTDAPDALLLPCYLSDATPGLVLARRNSDRWVFASSDASLEQWLTGGGGPSPALPSGRPVSGPSAGECPAPFEHGEHRVLFDNKGILDAATESILKGRDYHPTVKRPAARGAWRRAACVYALWIQRGASRDLRQCGWSDGMARCVEDLASALGDDTQAWFGREDGPRTFAEKFTVTRGGAPAEDATGALAALLDALVRPHGRTATRRAPSGGVGPSGPRSR